MYPGTQWGYLGFPCRQGSSEMRGFRVVIVRFWTRGKRLLESAQVMYQPRVQEASIINTICTRIKILQTLSWSIVEAKPERALMLRSRMQGGRPRSAARVPRNRLAIGFFCVVESQHSFTRIQLSSSVASGMFFCVGWKYFQLSRCSVIMQLWWTSEPPVPWAIYDCTWSESNTHSTLPSRFRIPKITRGDSRCYQTQY